MGHQGIDGWYPECESCNGGNLGKVYCEDCVKKFVQALKEVGIHQHKAISVVTLDKIIKEKLGDNLQ